MSRHTLAEAKAVLAETAAILKRDRRAVTATAKARNIGTTKPATTETFEGAVCAMMAKGLTKAKATRAVAIEHPDLHRDYIARVNATARRREADTRDQAARDRAARRRR